MRKCGWAVIMTRGQPPKQIAYLLDSGARNSSTSVAWMTDDTFLCTLQHWERDARDNQGNCTDLDHINPGRVSGRMMLCIGGSGSGLGLSRPCS